MCVLVRLTSDKAWMINTTNKLVKIHVRRKLFDKIRDFMVFEIVGMGLTFLATLSEIILIEHKHDWKIFN